MNIHDTIIIQVQDIGVGTHATSDHRFFVLFSFGLSEETICPIIRRPRCAIGVIHKTVFDPYTQSIHICTSPNPEQRPRAKSACVTGRFNGSRHGDHSIVCAKQKSNLLRASPQAICNPLHTLACLQCNPSFCLV